MDTYIESIEFIDNDILLNTRIIEPILNNDINEDNVGKSSGEIGDIIIRRISEFT